MIPAKETSNNFVTDYFQQVNFVQLSAITQKFQNIDHDHCTAVFSATLIGYFQILFKAKKWISLFTSIQGAGGICDGYSKANVTPYMHCTVYHVPGFMRKHGGIKTFTGQGKLYYEVHILLSSSMLQDHMQIILFSKCDMPGHDTNLHLRLFHFSIIMTVLKIFTLGIEKNNDDCRRIHLNKSNKWDASADVLRVMKRIERLQRTPREYRKRKDDYWTHELSQRRTKQKLEMQQSNNDDASTHSSQVDVEKMSVAELRERLKIFRIQTRVRKLTHLQKMYRDALNSHHV